MSAGVQLADALELKCARIAERAAQSLLGRQHRDGFWWGELTADTTLESDYIWFQLWVHPPQNGVWNPPTRLLIDKAVRTILAGQLPDGGFNIYPTGPTEINATVKAYFALKVAGIAIDDERMVKARQCIINRGGIQAANSYVKVNLSLFNLYPREHVPAIPPEIMLLGNFIYEMSSWTRAIVIPLSVVYAANPQRPVPSGFNLEELFVSGAVMDIPNNQGLLSWRNFFLSINWGLKFWDKYGLHPIRQKAIKKAEKWMLEHFEYSGGLGAIYPPMQYAVLALDVLGYAPDHPVRAEAVRQFDSLMVDDGERFFFQPCFSPVWDTGIAAAALGESGLAPKEAMQRCADWLLAKEVRRKGDWSLKRPRTEPSGWYFEFANEFYPDIDDTAQVLLGLHHARSSNAGKQEEVEKRAVAWLLDMQSSDGGWAAFDVDNDWHMLSEVPFADHNAMLDPTCPDITGRVMEALLRCGVDQNHPAIRRGVDYLVRTQEPDGSWFGRWGVNYIYGTFLALRGLRAAGESDRETHMLRGAEWLRSIQNADNGWGESCESYDRGVYVNAESTASQSAWALMGLLAAGDTNSLSVRNGIEYLIATQRPDGTWHENLATGTGFPKVFYLKYHLYRDMFPLMALASYMKRGELQ